MLKLTNNKKNRKRKKMEKHKHWIVFVLLIFAITGACFLVKNQIENFEKNFDPEDLPALTIDSQNNQNIEPTAPTNKEVKAKQTKKESDSITLTLNDVSDYKNLSKEEFYALRKKYIASSLFGAKNYVPSEEVFGGIAWKNPWYGLEYSGCMASAIGSQKAIEGPSEESRFLNNPNILVGIISGSYQVATDNPICFDKSYWFIPSSLSYSKKTNTITSVYSFRYSWTMSLIGLNARDLGYKYIYADKTANVQFEYSPNISNEIYELRDYIHLGSSCRYKNGCNNGSPHQSHLDVKFVNFPAIINIKLWKDMPATPQSPADINYQIIFE